MKRTRIFLRTIGQMMAVLFLIAIGSRASGDTVSLNGFEMHYETDGQGPPLLLLHGFLQAGVEWSPIREELASAWTLIIPDLRGHGSSTNPSGTLSNRQFAQDVFALLDHLDIGQFQAVGYSTGGEVLLHMAIERPDRVEAMVLIGATPYYTEQAREVLRSGGPGSVPEELMEEFRTVHKHGDEQIMALLRQDRAFADDYEDQNFNPSHLSTITARTLVMQGDRDRYNPVSIAIEMYEAIPDSYLWIVPNMDHLAMWGPIQDHFVCTATAFLRDQWQSRPARLCE